MKIIKNRNQALMDGDVKFFTGVPCRKGHISERYTKHNSCVECANTRATQRYLENKDEILIKQRIRSKEYYNANKEIYSKQQKARCLNRVGCKSKENQLFYAAKHRAKRNGLEFNIEITDIIIPDYCPVFPEMELDKNNRSNSKPNSPSLDRHDNTLGYVKGNIYVISHRANSLKSSGNIEEFRKILKYMEFPPGKIFNI